MKPSVTLVNKAKTENALQIIQGLKKNYPDAHCALVFKNPFELLIATILSAQCTDERVNQVTQVLFAVYPTPLALSEATLPQIEKIIFSAGFYKNKAKSLKTCATTLVEKYKSEVPQNLDQLVELPGVGRKTANVVLGNAYGIISGIVVDTHVSRLTNRFGWVKTENAVILEQKLMKFVPHEDWIMISHYLISHGRSLCKARSPSCDKCFLFDLCSRKGV
ncbi:MAG: endonuclease III [Pseudobdellovibrionaceae bacterium]